MARNPASSVSLPERPAVSARLIERVAEDYGRFAESGLPSALDDYLRDRYQLDLATEYAGSPIPNPWGKASGQLSMTPHQVQEDVDAGLGFVVLKTVIAQDAAGDQSMKAWAIPEARMLVEPIVGQSGERGWTVSWKGRGWWHSFDDYLQLIRDARCIAAGTGTLIVPSCKFHLPTPDEQTWKEDEYRYTARRLLDTWQQAGDSDEPMPLEKDFSPTLAGSDRATGQAKILDWLRTVPGLIRSAVSNRPQEAPVRVGLKIFNALFDDQFQVDMLRAIHEPGAARPDFYIFGNRLFDPHREFDGHRGIAYGGPDLSDRNLRVMRSFRELAAAEGRTDFLDWSATGNIVTGKTALEYALLGASSFQLHTFFQLPGSQYHMKVGSKIQKALHELYFHPGTGLIIWLHHLAGTLGLPTQPLRFRDVVGRFLTES